MWTLRPSSPCWGALFAAGVSLAACSLESEPFPLDAPTGAGAGSATTSGVLACDADDDCPPPGPCEVWQCAATGLCAVTHGATPLLDDPPGDCQTRTCTADGTLVEQEALTDLPPDDGNPCTLEGCSPEGQPIVDLAPPGEPCGVAPTCSNGVATSQSSCDGAGVCLAGQQMLCAPYACDAATGGCKTACTVATEAEDCLQGYCDSGFCLSTKGPGEPCSAPGECFTSFCVDGVCCTSPCDGACTTCNLFGGSPGTCASLPLGIQDSCSATQACNGGACVPLLAKKYVGQPCTTNNDCLNNNCYQGLCRLPNGEDCSAIQDAADCQSNLCKSGACQPCTSADDCGGNVCVNGRCTLPSGAHCGTDIDCLSGTCFVNPPVCQ